VLFPDSTSTGKNHQTRSNEEKMIGNCLFLSGAQFSKNKEICKLFYIISHTNFRGKGTELAGNSRCQFKKRSSERGGGINEIKGF